MSGLPLVLFILSFSFILLLKVIKYVQYTWLCRKKKNPKPGNHY